MITTTVTIVLECERCAACGVPFGIESKQRAALRKSHERFYCPNGHNNYYPGQTEEERRIAELERINNNLRIDRDNWANDFTTEREARQQVQRSLAATKGVLTKTKKRVACGVCPCCSRSFANLKRHMQGQHPGYIETECEK